MKYHITKVSFTDKKKDGSQILNKWGKVSYRVGLKVKEYGDRWVNGFTPFPPDRWENTEQELVITEVFDEFTQSQQLKFELPKKAPLGISDADRTLLIAIQSTLARVEAKLDKALTTGEDIQMPFPDEDEMMPQ